MSGTDREEYARHIALLTACLVESVHDRDGASVWHWATQIAALPAPKGDNAFVSALVVLAAQIDPNSTLDARVAWCHPDVVNACGGVS